MNRAALTLMALLTCTTCSFGVDPNQGRFSCATTVDCGSGYVCVQQANGSGGRCFPNGQCTPEICDGRDNDCDGVIDNGFNLQTDNLNCGACNHACPSGTTCTAGTCLETDCSDGIDNDGNGLTDCADPNCPGLPCNDAGSVCGTVWIPIPSDGGADAGPSADGGAADGGLADGGVSDGGANDAGADAGTPADAGAAADAGSPTDAGYMAVPACVP